MPNVFQIADQYRRELLQQNEQALSFLGNAWQATWERIRYELLSVLSVTKDAKTPAEAERTLRRANRLKETLDFVEAQASQFADQTKQVVDVQVGNAAIVAPTNTADLARAFIGDGRPSMSLIFNRPNPEAFERIVGVSRTGPLVNVFNQFGTDGAVAIQEALLDGVARGWNPVRIARAARDASEAVTLNRAKTITRTETLRAYREASRETYQANDDIVTGWIWHATLNGRTCAACIAMHGTKHDNDEPMGTHPNCRCTEIPYTKSWRDLGFDGIADTRPEIETGETWFARQPVELQKQILTPAKMEMYQAGEIRLRDLVARHESEDWGVTRTERSLRSVEELVRRRSRRAA